MSYDQLTANLISECKAKDAEIAALRAEYERACKLVADMHAAAMGAKIGPILDVVGDVAALRSENDALRAEVAGLRGALQGVLPWVVTQEVACNGLKCREPICMSCNSDSEANAQLACDAYAKASDALAARKGEA